MKSIILKFHYAQFSKLSQCPIGSNTEESEAH